MPVVFFGHGSPTNALESNRATRSWGRIARSIERPRAILSISAHWATNGTAVTAMERPQTIHDFGTSLPAPLFGLQYPAAGQPELAQRVCQLLAPLSVHMDQSWGLDHGTWSVLLKAYPAADIPVVQLSLDLSKPLNWHYKAGQLLQPLRREGVLIMGTGNIVHNLSVMQWDESATPYDWALRFNEYIKDGILNNEPQRVWEYRQLGRDADMSVPSTEHFCPLLYCLGAREDDDRVHIETDYIVYRSLGMTTVIFSEKAI